MNEIENLLAVFYVEKTVFEKGGISPKRVGPIIYLLDRKGMHFSYACGMCFLPLPSSDWLDEDLANLKGAGYLSSTANWQIGEKGIEYIETRGYKALDTLRTVETLLQSLLPLDENRLFSAIYNDKQFEHNLTQRHN